MASYRRIRKKYYFKTISLDVKMSNPIRIYEVLDSLSKKFEWKLLGLLGEKDKLELDIYAAKKRIFSDSDISESTFAYQGNQDVEITLDWNSLSLPRPRYSIIFSVGIGTRGEVNWELAKEIFIYSILSTFPYWGELNDLELSVVPAFYNINFPHFLIPHFGCANFLGSDLVDFFGGPDRIKKSGYTSVTAINDGLYIEAPKTSNPVEFRDHISRIEKALIPAEAFDDIIYGPVPHFKEWGDWTPPNEIESATIEGNIVNTMEFNNLLRPKVEKWELLPNKERIEAWKQFHKL